MQWKLVLTALLANAALSQAQPATTLKDMFQPDFRIGAALNQTQSDDQDPRASALVAAQFNTISPENVLKWSSLHPGLHSYHFDAADRYVAFGEKRHMFVVGHCLVWHDQVPAWVFLDDKGAAISRDALLARLHDHIMTVVGRYKGRIGGWDVVNEALSEDGTLRQTPWMRIIGDDYLVKAFEFAHEADPAAELYYNDYSLELPAKRAGAVKLIQKLKAAGVPVTAIGLQGHLHPDWPSAADEDATIRAFAELGIKVNITELDIDMLPPATTQPTADVSLKVEAQAKLDPYKDGLPEAQQQLLARRYAELFGVYYRNRASITRVTFWGLSDANSWLNDWPVRGRTNYPLLFDRALAPKPAFDAVMRVKAMAAGAQQAREDHQQLMDLLHIERLRPGANNRDRNAPNQPNYDESKANPYPKLPDPLLLKDGRPVTTAEMWWKERRPQIVEDFDREIYGRVPNGRPKVTWEVTRTSNETVAGVPALTKELTGHVDHSAYPAIKVEIQLTLTTPANKATKVPVMVEFGATSHNGPGDPPAWQREVLARGWGFALLSAVSIQADNGQGLRQGIIGLMNRGESRQPDQWGALRAWAWGASRVLDYFEADSAVDATRVGIEGHSRYGKAALVTMAYDPRFSIAYVSSSGEGGAKLHRRNFGELVENVAGAGEFYWMAGNFLKYAGPLTWDRMPVDSHELIALCAPRPVFIGSGTLQGDSWADPKGMFLAAAASGPVYKLLGKRDLGTAEFPPVETTLVDGDIAFRQHSGGHTPAPNWPTVVAFAARYWDPHK
jgi:GH35 family endo-1,4-beta-xylanase